MDPCMRSEAVCIIGSGDFYPNPVNLQQLSGAFWKQGIKTAMPIFLKV